MSCGREEKPKISRGCTPMIADKDFLTGRGWTRMKNVFAIIKTEAI